MAHKNGSDQAVSDTLWTLVSFQSVDFNAGGWYQSSTGSWAPPAGTVQINATLAFKAGFTANSTFGIAISLNGTRIRVNYVYVAGTSPPISDQSVSISLTYVVNGSQYFNVYGFTAGAGAPGGTIDGDGNMTYFSGTMV